MNIKKITLEKLLEKIDKSEYQNMRETGKLTMPVFHKIAELLDVDFKEAYRNYMVWWNKLSEVNDEEGSLYSKSLHKRYRK